ncbi:MAG: DNA translocase FtsK [Hyphomicrobiaceae bacterium]|nr:DNA translocase FtsK [Hyphomicrobiaceae bacterium]
MLSESPRFSQERAGPASLEQALKGAFGRLTGAILLAFVGLLWVAVASWTVTDPSLTHATSGETRNLLGAVGAIVSDLLLQAFGFATIVALAAPMFWGVELVYTERVHRPKTKLLLYPFAILVLAGAVSSLPIAERWPLHHGYGGMMGDAVYTIVSGLFALINAERGGAAAGLVLFASGFAILSHVVGVALQDLLAVGRETPVSAGARKFERSPVVQGAAAAELRIEPTFAPRASLEWAMATARQTAQRGMSAMQAGARGVREGLQAGSGYRDHGDQLSGRQTATPDHRAYAPEYYAAEAAAGLAHGGAADACGDGDPAYEEWNGARRQADAARRGQRVAYPMHQEPVAAYAPPFPPAGHPPRRPSRGPAAGLGGRDASDAAHDDFADDAGFDDATDHASRAIAERFAPAATGFPRREADLVGADDVTPPHTHTPAAAPKSAMQSLLKGMPFANAASPKMPPPPTAPPPAVAAPPAASGVAPSHPAARAAETIPSKRNALFGGLTFRRQAEPSFKMPPVALLKKPVPNKAGPEFTQTVLRGNARLLEDVLSDFGVKGEVKDIRPGPVVTLFELEPARGTKSSRVIGLADDIARSMSAAAVRVAVVPGRNAIGIEMPNVRRETVMLRELLESDAFRSSDAALPVALGKSIGGEPVVADLARMPHLLVAGTTGSGKSVGVNAMILSLLYRHSPAECRFLMIDPKMLELSVYNGIPHLLAPVVTDPQKAVAALNWVVSEMEERYKRMAKLSVRNIDVFNNRVRNARKRGEMIARTVQTGFDRQTGEAMFEQEQLALEPMPYIVVVIDEFADLMLVAGKEVEAAVQRLAQMARAAGIHIIMATQRPSVDVITGTIKANFPTRISFKVTSKIDSRTILTEQGAEQLLGQGDMLFAAGSGQIARVHGPFVADDEVEEIAGFLRAQGEPDYVVGITEPPVAPEAGADDARGQNEEDAYDRAVAIVLRDRKASTSYIQRRLSIGYNRAADLIERMEREGLIGPANNVGRREILVGANGASDAA